MSTYSAPTRMAFMSVACDAAATGACVASLVDVVVAPLSGMATICMGSTDMAGRAV